ncbi:hypothetical protein [Spirosoma spitsbergense]|uniref:hypothetical protein n=1 Tax=Spirosoma spitsbergense TaxID=431554 RepID=UPI0003630E2B|nr:hypothetical protein [Spirosoma spitsbergense]
MNRAEKIALLTSVLQQGNSHTNRQRLQRVRENAPRSLVIIDDLDFELGQPMTDTDPVHFKDKGQEHQMTLGEAYQYARRYSIRTLIVLPAKQTI